MKKSKIISHLNSGLVILSSDYKVIGMNAYARKVFDPLMTEFGKSVFHYHPKKSHSRIKSILKEACDCSNNVPAAMVIKVLDKVLLINVCKIEIREISLDPLFAMNFFDVTEKRDVEIDHPSTLEELKKYHFIKRIHTFFWISPPYVAYNPTGIILRSLQRIV